MTLRGSAAERLAETDPPTQLSLPFFAMPVLSPNQGVNGAARSAQAAPIKPSARLPSLDRLTVREVLKVVPVNRSTLFRWVNSGRFPKRHKAGGWLRSDIEKWLTAHEGEEH
ncbi:MAG: AlpA family phage regulatory protein [Proteobacteria bacterium]|nr:AlpA family phage regulatory protein [Pseudomonadota bacterium]